MWRARFMPDEVGAWMYETICSDDTNAGLQAQRGTFECSAPLNETAFDRHGAIRVAKNSRYLEHADGTPFLWLGDTVWNGPLLSTDEEWELYVRTRATQTFNAAQWVTTQWLASPTGDRRGEVAYTAASVLRFSPTFFNGSIIKWRH